MSGSPCCWLLFETGAADATPGRICRLGRRVSAPDCFGLWRNCPRLLAQNLTSFTGRAQTFAGCGFILGESRVLAFEPLHIPLKECRAIQIELGRIRAGGRSSRQVLGLFELPIQRGLV